MPRRSVRRLWLAVLVALPVLASLAACDALEAGTVATMLLVSLAALAAALAAIRRIERDVLALAETARRAGRPDLGEPVPSASRPLLGSVAVVSDEIDRLARKLSERAALIETLLGAEEALVERLPDPLILLGADRSVRRVNHAARQMFGAELPSLLRHPSLRAAITDILAGADRHHAQVDVTLGAPIAHDLAAAVIGLAPPLPGGGRILVLVSDRTRERVAERTRTDFIANVSHELRTPLTSLIGFIETLAGPASDDRPAQARFLEIMAAQAARMNRLIDGLLNLSRIEVIEHRAPQDTVEVGAVLARAVAAIEARIGKLGRTLELEIAPVLPDVRADEDQLLQVVENLLDNACKYGRPGGRIGLSAQASPGGRPGVVIEVRNDGPGIAREHLPRLTERFYRVDPSRSAGPAGSGLGLAIVKHVVNRHRGTLAIESEPGGWTRFRITLPAAA